MVTDFKSTLISRRKLEIVTPEFSIKYRAENEDEPRASATTYRNRLQHTGTLAVAELTEFLTSTDLNSHYGDKLPMIQALNILRDNYAKSTPDIAATGSSKSLSLDVNASKRELCAGLTALRGFFSSVRVATCRILVNVNVTHGAFYDPIPLDQLIQKYGPAHGLTVPSCRRFSKECG